MLHLFQLPTKLFNLYLYLQTIPPSLKSSQNALRHSFPLTKQSIKTYIKHLKISVISGVCNICIFICFRSLLFSFVSWIFLFNESRIVSRRVQHCSGIQPTTITRLKL